MTKAIGRQARKQISQRLQSERLAKPTSTQIKHYRCSSLRRTMILNIKSLTPVTARSYNSSKYVQLLGFLGLEISLENANRPGELMNMSVDDFNNRLRKKGEIKLKILLYKTLVSQGPAYISVTNELKILLLHYFNFVKPSVVRSDSPFFFKCFESNPSRGFHNMY